MKLILLGDIMLGRLFNTQVFPNHTLTYPFGNVLTILKSANIVGCNLETTITDSTDKYPNKIFNYKMLPKYAKSLKMANISYCSLANNHIFDFKIQGMKDTIYNLNKLDIKYAGVGDDILEAQIPTFIVKNGIKIGFLSAADHYDYWNASKNTPGIWYIPIRDGNTNLWKKVFEIVKRTKKMCDYLIFSLHWNYNYVDIIHENFIKFAHLLIDSGVNIIHGHSPHHLLPIEKYKNGIIFYSLGDFIDDYAVDKKYRNDLSIMAEIKITKKILDIMNIYPTKISNFQTNLVKNKNELSFIYHKLYGK